MNFIVIKLLVTFFLFSFSSSAISETYLFGIVPQQSATKLARSWIPIINHLEKETGLKIKFATAPNIPEFEKRLRNGLYDFAYMNPYHYTVFNQTTGYKAFVKQSNKKIKGILVVHKDSKIKSINDLDNKIIVFPAPAAFAATLLVKSYLKSNNVNFNSKYVSSHDSVYRSIAQNLASAGGGIMRTLHNVEPKIRNELTILWTSNGYTPHAFAYHPRVNKSIVDQITSALLKLNFEEYRPILTKMNFKGIDLAVDSDWDDVRTLRINELKTSNKSVRN